MIHCYFGHNADRVFIKIHVAPWEPISTKGEVPWEGVASNFLTPANAPLQCEFVYKFTLKTQDETFVDELVTCV